MLAQGPVSHGLIASRAVAIISPVPNPMPRSVIQRNKRVATVTSRLYLSLGTNTSTSRRRDWFRPAPSGDVLRNARYSAPVMPPTAFRRVVFRRLALRFAPRNAVLALAL